MMARGRADVGSDAGAGGGFPALAGPVARGVEQGVIEGGGGAPVPGDGPAAGGGGGAALGAGAFGGPLVPPGVVKSGHLVAEFRADGAGVTADEFGNGCFADAEGAGEAGGAVAHDVQRAQPQPGAAGIQAGARHGHGVHGQDGGRGAAGGTAAAGGQIADGGRGQAGGGGDGLVGAAVLVQAVDAGAGGARPGGAGGRMLRARGAGRPGRGC